MESIALPLPGVRPIRVPWSGIAAALAGMLVVVAITAASGGSALLEPPGPPATGDEVRSTELLADLPTAWAAADTGQHDAGVRYAARGVGYAAFLTDRGMAVNLGSASVHASFTDIAATPRLEPMEPLTGTVSNFAGSDAGRWQAGTPTNGAVRYTGLWPGTDVVVRGTGTSLEWDYIVAAGADPTLPGVTLVGVDRLHVEAATATAYLGEHELTLRIPAVWQEAADGRVIARAARWRVDGATLRVEVDGWNPGLAGVIDPTLEWSTFLGETSMSGNTYVAGIAVDAAGSVYTAGQTVSGVFPTTPGSYDTSHNGGIDVFVTKFDPAGNALAYSTFLGGAANDEGYGIAVDAGGNTYITGVTDGGFPTTAGAYDTSANGDRDAFVAKLGTSGATLVYSTLLGGASVDVGRGIAVDDSGGAYVTGDTTDAGVDFPTTAGAFDTGHNGDSDGFAAKLAPGGATLAYSTFLGGISVDQLAGIAVDGTGAAYVTGFTFDGTVDYPTTPGAFDPTPNGSTEAVLTKLAPDGATLVYSTFLGGSSLDNGSAVAVDSQGSAYVTGGTVDAPIDFPTTVGAFDTTHNGISYDVFVSKLNASGATLVYSTFVGGGLNEGANAIAVDVAGAVHLTGFTQDASVDFPTTPGAVDTSPNGGNDAFATTLNPSGSALRYSTFLGGSGTDYGWAIAAGAGGTVAVGGSTNSAGFPTTAGSFDPVHVPGGGTVGFVTLLDFPPPLVPSGDVDGDGDTGPGVWRPSTGAWYLESGPPTFLGAAGDIPVPGPWDADRDVDRAVWRPSTGAWYVESDPPQFFGAAGDVPVPCDWDGDGAIERAVFRADVGGWYVDGGSTDFFGLAGDIPVPGDWDDDGDCDRAIWRPSVGGWYVDLPGHPVAFWGLDGDVPFAGNWDDDDDWDRAIWRPSVGGWYVDGGPTTFFGLDDDEPAAGQWDPADPSLEIAIWRPAVGGWYVDGGPTTFLGLPGDVQLVLPHHLRLALS